MLKDSKRFADGNGWGYGAFEFDTAPNTFRPANLDDKPPQVWVACHLAAKDWDYVFTQYAMR